MTDWIKCSDMQMEDTLIHKVSSEIAGNEREIVNDFCKAFIAQKCLDGYTISTIFDDYELCVCHDFSKSVSSRYWFQKRYNHPERSKREDFYQKLAKEYIDGKENWQPLPNAPQSS